MRLETLMPTALLAKAASRITAAARIAVSRPPPTAWAM
ncbi:hypothetical protein SRABI128_06567 [Microbacterium sp. Bi128]|nr:hypothetical protein SRABI128_06567 [Microbacterium sp. Bi128]